jgi:hypothetical protein
MPEDEAVGRAIAAVDAILSAPDRDPGFEPDDEISARAAVVRFAERFANADGWVRSVVEGARAGARGLSGDRLQGISELVQNADDAGAKVVRIAVGPECLIVVHDGRPVTLRDLFALAAPWVTTKKHDPGAIGKFGIGLMTLQSISPTLEVFAGPYRVRLGDEVSYIEDPSLPGFLVEPELTLIRIPLEGEDLDPDAIDGWLETWGHAGMLFCRHVESISLEVEGRVVRTLGLSWVEHRPAEARIGSRAGQVRRRTATAASGQSWAVYTAEVPPPKGVQRARKATSDLTPLGVALPFQHDKGFVYAGLPVIPTDLRVRVNAQFDPLTGRQGLVPDSEWNHKLCPLIAELWTESVLDLFANRPAECWSLIPIEDPREEHEDEVVAAVEAALLEAARTVLPARLEFEVKGIAYPVAHLALEAPELEGVITSEEVARLAGAEEALPTEARDPAGRWRVVHADWTNAGTDLLEPVGVKAALPLLEEGDRSVERTLNLTAVALREGFGDEVAELACVITRNGERVCPPQEGEPWSLVLGEGGLGTELGLTRVLHESYAADAVDANEVAEWLLERGALLDPKDPVSVIQRLAGAGEAGRLLDEPLRDDQLRSLRDAFEMLDSDGQQEFAPGVGRAILIEAYEYGHRGKRVDRVAAPADIYLPSRIDRDPNSFAVAAGQTRGLLWAQDRYADVLRSSLGRAGLGAQRFLRLLGAETAPRLKAHHALTRRYPSDRRMGLPATASDSPPQRAQAMASLHASYTLEDVDSPDLTSVLLDMARDRKAKRRRERAAAIIETLGRAWERFADQVEVTAVEDYYAWNPRGSVRAFWVWRATTIAWLDDSTAHPREPAELRLRTPSTVAVHGPDAPGYVHKDVPVARRDVLAALGVSGDPSTGELVERLRDLRSADPPPATIAADVGLAYQGLAHRLGDSARVPGDLGPTELVRAFAQGPGLILTNVGWRPPTKVFRGPPVFGLWRPFAPQVQATDGLWKALHVRDPSDEDCVSVLQEIARRSDDLDVANQAVVLETLRVLARRLQHSPSARLRRRLSQLALWTTKGWLRSRPVYAIDDRSLAHGLGGLAPMWIPGGEMGQFRSLLPYLRVTELSPDDVSLVRQEAATPDEEMRSIFARAVPLLKDDLARNEPATERALRVDWDELARYEVQIDPGLRVRVHGLQGEPPVVRIAARVESDHGVLYLADPNDLARVDGGGHALARLFEADRRRVAHAWLAACDNAKAGRRAERLLLAEEHAERQRAETDAAIAARLEAFRLQVEEDHRSAATTERTPSRQPARPDDGGQEQGRGDIPRVLVNPSDLRLLDVRGRRSGRGGTTTQQTKTTTSAPRDLPQPAPGGARPRQVTPPPQYTPGSKEAVGLELVKQVLGGDGAEVRDLRAQHGVGADAVDAMERYFELKVYAGSEPDRITLEKSQILRALSTPAFFLAVVSGVEGERASPQVRIIVDPLAQLSMTEASSVGFTGVRTAESLVYDFVRDENDN